MIKLEGDKLLENWKKILKSVHNSRPIDFVTKIKEYNVSQGLSVKPYQLTGENVLFAD